MLRAEVILAGYLAWAQGLFNTYMFHADQVDQVRERLKMSVKTLASWSAHAPSTHPGNPSGPAALLMLTCSKVSLTSATESVITQLSVRVGALLI